MQQIKKVLRPIKRAIKNKIVSYKMKLNSKLIFKSDDLICFICQNQSVWKKTKPVVAELVNKKNNIKLLLVDDSVLKNDELTVFEKDFPNHIVKYEKGIFDKLHVQLLVYSRPYSSLLPKELRIENACKVVKTAYIPYYYSTDTLVLDGFDDWFHKYLNYYFPDQAFLADYFNLKINSTNQIAYNLGYPSLEKTNLYLDVDKRKLIGKKVVVWTPRWTSDVTVGSSNFFKYVDRMLDYFINNDKYIFVFRPHPLLFSNFIKTGELSPEKKDEILKRIAESNNSFYDFTDEYTATVNYCDILISDTSSIIIEFAALGKAIIFCDNYDGVGPRYTDIMNEINDTNYIAKSFEDIENALLELDMEDIKKDERIQLANKILEENKDSSLKIANKIIEITTFQK